MLETIQAIRGQQQIPTAGCCRFRASSCRRSASLRSNSSRSWAIAICQYAMLIHSHPFSSIFYRLFKLVQLLNPSNFLMKRRHAMFLEGDRPLVLDGAAECACDTTGKLSRSHHHSADVCGFGSASWRTCLWHGIGS